MVGAREQVSGASGAYSRRRCWLGSRGDRGRIFSSVSAFDTLSSDSVSRNSCKGEEKLVKLDREIVQQKKLIEQAEKKSVSQ